MDKLHKLLRAAISRAAQWYWIGTVIITPLYAILAAWSQISGITVLGYRPSDKHLFYGMILTYFGTNIFGWIKTRSGDYRIDDIEKSHLEQIKYYEDTLFDERLDVMKDHLREIADGLAFSMQERICVYRFIDTENCFDCVGRYSAHQLYDQSSIRKRYPVDIGVIGHVWNSGQHNGFIRDSNIPDINNRKGTYFKYLKDIYKIPRDVSKHFRMNSIDIIAEVIRDTKDKPVAVIIFESQRRAFLDESKIHQTYNRFKKNAIIAMLDKLKEQNIPNLETARKVRL